MRHPVRRAPALGVLLAAVAVVAVAIPAASAGSEIRHRYVANRSTGSDLLPIAEHHMGATGDSWTLDGFGFEAEGSDFVLTVDDAAIVSPLTVPVLVIDTDSFGERRFRTQCVENRHAVTFDVGSPDSSVVVRVFNHSEAPWAGCRFGSAGTTGTLTVVP